MNLKSTLFSLLVLLTATINAQVVYVVEGATGSGLSWLDATGNLSEVLENASPGSEIWVAAGTYYPLNCSPCSDTDRDIPFELKEGVLLYGGFYGTETSVDQRDWQANPSVLSGDIDQDGTIENNSQTVVYTKQVSNATVIDGFTITGGNADLSAAVLGHRRNSGAGWFNDGQLIGFSSHPVIRNCTFSDNHAVGFGGGIYNEAGFNGSTDPVFENCSFLENSATFGGGAVFNQANFSGNCHAIFTGCVFTNNESTTGGGAIFNQGAENGLCSPIFNNCIFADNLTSVAGGAVMNVGRNGNSSPVFTDCIFDENHSDNGGGLYNDASYNGLCMTQLENCTFKNNISNTDGGGVFNLGSESGTCNIILIDCLFESNHSVFAGGGIFNNGINGECSPIITNCKFISNVADTYGGGVYNLGKNGNSSPILTNCLFANNTGSSAGGMYNLGSENGNSSPTITNCTFYGNTANVGGAVYNNANDTSGNASPMITNTIFWNNQSNFGAVFRNIFGTPVISYSIVDQPDCFSLNNGINSNVTCGDGMIYNQYPNFTDPVVGDFTLQENSPSIDMGYNPSINATGVAIDLNHQLRIYNGTVDIGAYEYQVPNIPPQIIQQPNDLEVCEGLAASFEVEAAGISPLNYQWLKDGSAISGANSNVYQIQAVELSQEGNYNCLVISASGDTVSSETALLQINPLLMPEVDVTASEVEICAGEVIEFIATTLNEGMAPGILWFINGTETFADSLYFSTTDLANGDAVYCELISSESCLLENPVYSDTVEIIVYELLETSIELEASSLEICEGQEVSFNANVNNIGNSPAFQWFLNGIETGGNGSVFISNTLENGDSIHCVLNSSENCVINNSLASNVLQLAVHDNLGVGISISVPDTTLCVDDAAIFTAILQNGGQNPFFDWQLNGQSLNVNTPELMIDTLSDGDEVRCFLTSSEACTLENPSVSNTVIVSVDSCLNVSVKETNFTSAITIYPNPAVGNFYVQPDKKLGLLKLEIFDIQGRMVWETKINSETAQPYLIQSGSLPKGFYFIKIYNQSVSFTYKQIMR